MNLRLDSFEAYQEAYQKSANDPSEFWNGIASQFQWMKPHHQTQSGSLEGGDVQWFVGGQVNITENALDRHLAERGNQTAIVWEPNDPDHSIQSIS